MCEHSYKLGESRPSLKIVVASHRLCSQIFGFSEILAKGLRPTKSDFGNDKYFWVPNSMTMNSTYVQKFYKYTMMIKELNMSEIGVLYIKNVEGSYMERNAEIHIKNYYGFPVELNTLWGQIVGENMCLGGGGTKMSL